MLWVDDLMKINKTSVEIYFLIFYDASIFRQFNMLKCNISLFININLLIKNKIVIMSNDKLPL